VLRPATPSEYLLVKPEGFAEKPSQAVAPDGSTYVPRHCNADVNEAKLSLHRYKVAANRTRRNAVTFAHDLRKRAVATKTAPAGKRLSQDHGRARLPLCADTELTPALSPAPVEDPAALLGGHTSSKTVRVPALASVRLKRSFHIS